MAWWFGAALRRAAGDGLNFVNKPLRQAGRCMALLYGANDLKQHLKFHGVDWPKHGRSLRLGDGSA